VLRRIFGPKRDEETGGCRKLHNEELHTGIFLLPHYGWSNGTNILVTVVQKCKLPCSVFRLCVCVFFLSFPRAYFINSV
jgi:hypothetical protein